MKQTFKHKASVIINKLENDLGFRNINIEKETSECLSNLIRFLELEDILKVTGAYCLWSTSDIEYTLEGQNNISLEVFQSAIKKFQDAIFTESIDKNKDESQNVIKEIEIFINSIPQNEFDIFIGMTGYEESTLKIKLEFPKYWYWRKVDKNIGEIYDLFYKRLSYRGNILEDFSNKQYIYLYTKTKRKTFWQIIFG